MSRTEAALAEYREALPYCTGSSLVWAALKAADQWDAAHGIHRVAIDDETIERASEAVDKFTEDFFHAVVAYSDREDLIRAILAAAKKVKS